MTKYMASFCRVCNKDIQSDGSAYELCFDTWTNNLKPFKNVILVCSSCMAKELKLWGTELYERN